MWILDYRKHCASFEYWTTGNTVQVMNTGQQETLRKFWILDNRKHCASFEYWTTGNTVHVMNTGQQETLCKFRILDNRKHCASYKYWATGNTVQVLNTGLQETLWKFSDFYSKCSSNRRSYESSHSVEYRSLLWRFERLHRRRLQSDWRGFRYNNPKIIILKGFYYISALI